MGTGTFILKCPVCESLARIPFSSTKVCPKLPPRMLRSVRTPEDARCWRSSEVSKRSKSFQELERSRVAGSTGSWRTERSSSSSGAGVKVPVTATDCAWIVVLMSRPRSEKVRSFKPADEFGRRPFSAPSPSLTPKCCSAHQAGRLGLHTRLPQAE